MIKNAFVFKVFDVSTGHMEESDADMLTNYLENLSAYELGEYGWLVYAGEIDYNWEFFSEHFKMVLKKAKEMDCDYVRFDRDGMVYDEFPTFDW